MNDANQLYDFIRLVRPLYKVLEGAVSRELDGSGSTITERAVLEQLHDHGPLPVPRIADRIIAPRQFIQRTANALLNKGLIERRKNKAHRRSDLLALSPSGAVLIRSVLEREALNIESVAKNLPLEDIAAAQRVAIAMISGFAEMEDKDD